MQPETRSPEQRVADAARWLADQETKPKPIVPTLRGMFDLTAVQAVEAIRVAQSFRAQAKRRAGK